MELIRRVEISDLGAITDLERLFFLDYWKGNQVQDQIDNEKSINLCIENDSVIVGYVFAKSYLDFVEILRIGVSKDFREIGMASMLMRRTELISLDMKIKKILLEVREGNVAAINLYKKMDYKIDGTRKGYYKKYKEDAILMSKNLG